MSSSVFLSNVDDYLAPSQACVNPLFSEKTNAAAAADKEQQHEQQAAAPVVGSVVPRRRRPRANNIRTTVTQDITATTNEPKDTVKASIADCLACSGCVTTAETVLLEETHSLQLIRNKWEQTEDYSLTQERMVATLSPAAWADLMRHVGDDDPPAKEEEAGNNDVATAQRYRDLQRRWATLLAETLGFVHVLDGNLPLQWSLEAAVGEFCQAQTSTTKNSSRLAASCPAVVCLVEKSSHGAVPHLSQTPSAQALAGAFWKHTSRQNNTKCFHVAVMPCHDKKLEASRPELLSTHNKDDEKQVDLVLTTQDCIRLILERLKVKDGSDDEKALLQRRLQEASLANVVDISHANQEMPQVDWSAPTLWAPPMDQMQITNTNHDASSPSIAEQVFAFGSGGYADYIFRQASHRLFGFTNLPASLPWKPVATANSNRRVSARVAAASTQRDYFQVALYRRTDGTYSLEEDSASNEPPVLCFAMAYGMQTLQRILAPYENQDNGSSTRQVPFHYVEAMACPSGCVNGGGQIRLAERERPTQTKERVQQTRSHFQRPTAGAVRPSWMTTLPPTTEFRAVAPLQLAQGAVKGVAVKDVQW